MDPWDGRRLSVKTAQRKRADPWQSYQRTRWPSARMTQHKSETLPIAMSIKHDSGLVMHFRDTGLAKDAYDAVLGMLAKSVNAHSDVMQHGRPGEGWRSKLVAKKAAKSDVESGGSVSALAVESHWELDNTGKPHSNIGPHPFLKFAHLDIEEEVTSRMKALEKGIRAGGPPGFAWEALS